MTVANKAEEIIIRLTDGTMLMHKLYSWSNAGSFSHNHAQLSLSGSLNLHQTRKWNFMTLLKSAADIVYAQSLCAKITSLQLRLHTLH